MQATNTRAVIWVLMGTALFSLVFASGKFAGGTATPAQVIYIRYISGMACLLLVVWALRRPLKSYRSANPGRHLIRAVLGCFGGYAINHASASMPILDATAISLLYVVLIVALGAVVLKEQISRPQLLAIVLSTLGAAVVMGSRGAFQSFNESYMLPAAVAFTGAVLIALEALYIRTLSQAESLLGVLLYVNFFGLFLMAPAAWWDWQPVTIIDCLPYLILGPIGITAQYCIVRGYRMADISLLGPVDYFWLVFAALIGFVFFDEWPTAGVIAGAGLITLGGILLARCGPARRKTSGRKQIPLAEAESD